MRSVVAIAVVAGLVLALGACGRKNPPEAPGGKQAGSSEYPKPDPMPGTPPAPPASQQKK